MERNGASVRWRAGFRYGGYVQASSARKLGSGGQKNGSSRSLPTEGAGREGSEKTSGMAGFRSVVCGHIPQCVEDGEEFPALDGSHLGLLKQTRQARETASAVSVQYAVLLCQSCRIRLRLGRFAVVVCYGSLGAWEGVKRQEGRKTAEGGQDRVR
jgi:hypothetical protein